MRVGYRKELVTERFPGFLMVHAPKKRRFNLFSLIYWYYWCMHGCCKYGNCQGENTNLLILDVLEDAMSLQF